MSRRMASLLAGVAIVAVVVVAVAAALVAVNLVKSSETASEAAPDAGAPAPGGGVKCGVERWAVKTLSDEAAAKVNFAPQAATVATLQSQKFPVVSAATKRLGDEMRTVTVTAQLLDAKVEDDHDIHLVIAEPGDPTKTMIVELPDVNCSGPIGSAKREEMRQAREAFAATCGEPPKSKFLPLGASATATITGVVFIDEIHGQRGVAPNGVEIHPVLKIEISNCR
jgi:hypothetical protein